jgi:hypothetical protein
MLRFQHKLLPGVEVVRWRGAIIFSSVRFYLLSINLSIYLSVEMCISKKKVRERERNACVGALSYDIYQKKFDYLSIC